MHSTKGKTRLFLNPSITLRTSLGLLAVLLTSCVSAAVTTESPPQSVPAVIEPRATPLAVTELTAEVPVDAIVQPTEAAAPAPFPVATSRGDALHATDPGMVNLASGDLQLVEFFRFT